MSASTTTAAHTCTSPDCGKPAKMQCPTCLKQNIEGSFFCDQDCFKRNWANHKSIHKPPPFDPAAYKPWPTFEFTGTLRPYPQSPKRTVPPHIKRPDYAETGISMSERRERTVSVYKELNEAEIAKARKACQIARDVLEITVAAVKVGITTDELDRIAHEACIATNSYPSPLNYGFFPKSICTSLNEVICHGIPDYRPLQNGDILNIDVSVYHNGYHGDVNETVLVGDVDEAGKKLVRVTRECLDAAIKTCKPGVAYREIGNAIQPVAHKNGFSVVRAFVGHGVHELFHCGPNIPHYAKSKAVGVMKKGHIFSIEPMINEGVFAEKVWPDNWTAATQDGKRSAQFEEVILITDDGAEVLTRRRTAGGKPYFVSQLDGEPIVPDASAQ